VEDLVPLGAAGVGAAAVFLMGGIPAGLLPKPPEPTLSAAQAATTTAASNPQPTGAEIFQALEAQRLGGNPQQPPNPQPSQQSGVISPGSVDKVEVSLAERTATMYRGGVPVKTYPVAVGKSSTPTPRGSFQIDEMEVDPSYLSPSGETIPPGPDNPLGNRWARFTTDGVGDYGFHGGDINSGSMGCVRLRDGDLQELYSSIRPGTQVEVY